MLGTALQQALAARSIPVVQLVRRAPGRAGQVVWDPAANPPIASLESIEGIAAAIHLSGVNLASRRWTPAFKREIVSSRVDSTHALATALAGLAHRPECLLVASATGIYGNRREKLLSETSTLGSGFLADVCRQWEAAAQPAVDAGIRVVHLRFGVVLGPEGALAKMLPIFRLGLGGPLGSGSQWMSWISLADAVAAILFVLRTPALTGPVNLATPFPVTNLTFTRILARALHRPAILPAPRFALRMILGEMADEALLSSARALPARLVAAGFQFNHPTMREAIDAALE
jgi:uncharacterized protein (TIGR01777 family)